MRITLRCCRLLFASLFLLGACKKAEPEPMLEGDWDVTSSVTTQYTVDGTPYSQNTTSSPGGNDVNARYAKITSTTIQVFYGTVATDAGVFYTRSGNVLSYSAILSGSSTPTPVGSATITQLTGSVLALLTKRPAAQPARSPDDYVTIEVHYTRR